MAVHLIGDAILPGHSATPADGFLKSWQSYGGLALLQILELSNVDWQLHEVVLGEEKALKISQLCEASCQILPKNSSQSSGTHAKTHSRI